MLHFERIGDFVFYRDDVDDFGIWNFLKQNVESERQCAIRKRWPQILNFSKKILKIFQRIVMLKLKDSFIQ